MNTAMSSNGASPHHDPQHGESDLPAISEISSLKRRVAALQQEVDKASGGRVKKPM
jgi:uncharacterized small protein (DUF1192 family)